MTPGTHDAAHGAIARVIARARGGRLPDTGSAHRPEQITADRATVSMSNSGSVVHHAQLHFGQGGLMPFAGQHRAENGRQVAGPWGFVYPVQIHTC